ncbi:hypothetical protein DBR11_24610 [Pedobacter sp. HMWF019]|uniref:PDDEXK-like family protein n=1 Tax=Pedobacter sp. HMWF019 TaxID=2056856 RepID=UPI000D33F939|nr:PD-(D/E)XK nuclease family protein [Pedobacter sp. HMWF019]PTS93781.1 hypothetical protein DBR11_24610 [Pedobacter sp. HMWF019]
MIIHKTENLLVHASAIIKQFERVAQLTGENFNVFKILKLSTMEVRTHSSFIAELLDPEGSHGQKEVFLLLFCDQFDIHNLNCSNAKVKVEKKISAISEDGNEGGNIDILITDLENNAVIIENKINAIDLEKQLLRYFNYGKTFTQHRLLYLTLNGTDPSLCSRISLKNEDFQKGSYSEDVLNWLEKCKEKSVDHPILRETITQYINLIKYLTHQTISSKMSEELISLISNNKEYYNSIDDLYDAYRKFKEQVKSRFMAAFYKKQLQEDTVMQISDLKFLYEILEDNEGFYYGFSVERGGTLLDGTSVEMRPYVDILRSINPKFRFSPPYIGWAFFDRFSKLLNEKELLFNLQDDRFLDNLITELINELNGVISELKMKLSTENVISILPSSN